MPRACNKCGASMVSRTQDTHADEQGPVRRSSSQEWWDCACGRTVAEYGASTALTLPFTVEDDQG